jgi:uncharacterized protein YegP (UPF0339 family)
MMQYCAMERAVVAGSCATGADGMHAAKGPRMNTFRTALFVAAISTLTACAGQEATVGQNDDASDTNDAALSTAKFETFTGKDGKNYFHLLAGNGQKVLASQGYASKSSALDGIASVKANSVDTSRYFMREASDGSWYFVVIAGNGQIVAVSEMYASESNATKGMTTVQGLVNIASAPTSAPTGVPAFAVFKGLDSKYYFHFTAANGEIMLQSQSYTTKTSANNGVASVKLNGGESSKFEVLAAADGEYFFHLKAANGQIIAHGETYSSLSAAQDAVTSIVAMLRQ